MTVICSDCGYDIPEDLEFCPRCGALKKFGYSVDNRGNLNVNAGGCENCGNPVRPGDVYCQNCGSRVNEAPQQPKMVFAKPKITVKGWIAIFLALVPGFFNIFGLGHLIYKKWSRGILYLMTTAVVFYLQYSKYDMDSIFMWIITIGLFVFQAFEVLGLAVTEGMVRK